MEVTPELALAWVLSEHPLPIRFNPMSMENLANWVAF